MRIAALLLVLLVGAVVYARWYVREDAFRYRLTVEIDTPTGIKSGSAVQQIALRREPRITPESGGWSLDLQGEAVPVEIASGRTVYALLKSPQGNFPWEVLKYSVGWGERADRLRDHLRQAKMHHATADLQPQGYPLFAAFTNPDDPVSVEAVNAANLATLSPGIHVHRITIAMTDEALTRSIRAHLPWLTSFPERRVIQPADPYDHSPAAKLSHGDFIMGSK